MDPTYALEYRTLHERHWWWRAREAVVARELERAKPSGGWRRALDVGCGDALHFPLLLRHAEAVEGVEPDRDLLTDQGLNQSGGEVHIQPFDATFRPDHTFDVMVFLDVLEHMDNPLAALTHAHTLMAPGGTLVATVPAWMHLWTTHDDLNHHVTRYTVPRLRRLLTDAGFTVTSARYFFRWVHAAKLVQRGMEALSRPAPTTPSVPPAPINGALTAASRLEEMALRWLPLPVGSSVLAVARKG